MGFSSILIVALLIGSYFLFRRLGWLNIFLTLGYPAEARFTRRIDETSGEAVYDVIPARPSWMYLLIMGGLVIFSFIILRATAPILLVLWPILLFFFLQPLVKDARYRKPAHLIVSAQSLSDGQRTVSLQQIAGLAVRKKVKVIEEPVATTYKGKPLGAMISRALGKRQADRSYLLTLRTRDSSEESVLCGGLTARVAEALRDDLKSLLG